MEEKLLELIKTAIECEKVSKKYYVEIHYIGDNTIEVDIRRKSDFTYINTTKINLDESIFTIDDIVQKLEKLIKEES